MPDRERVIYDIERCICRVPDACLDCSKYKCGYYAPDCMEQLLGEALELLKEPKPGCEHAEHDSNGCLGYSGCSQDDEPIEACKRCGKYTGNAEAEGGNGDV